MRPVASRDGLLVRELGEEVVVYDLERHEAHCLNRTAGLVFRYSDGRRTVAEIAARLQSELKLAADESVVWLALDRLDEAGLLVHNPGRPCEPGGWSRRGAMLRMGSGLAVLLPVVTSILVPTPAEAGASCVPAGACGTNSGAPCYRTSGSFCGQGCTCQGSTCTSGCCDGSGQNCSY